MCLKCRNGYNTLYVHVHVTGKELLKSKKRMAAMYFQDTIETRSKQMINSEKKREERLQAKTGTYQWYYPHSTCIYSELIIVIANITAMYGL